MKKLAILVFSLFIALSSVRAAEESNPKMMILPPLNKEEMQKNSKSKRSCI